MQMTILSRYLFLKFVKSIVAVFAVATFLIYVLDMIELTRISNDASANAILSAAGLAVLRTPVVAEQILPFAALFGALAAFLSLGRSRELVIARAAGMSVWRFLLPAVLAALMLGIGATLVFNPISAKLKTIADKESLHTIVQSANEPMHNVWIRQKSVDGEAILRAGTANTSAAEFQHITAFEFDKQGNFIHRSIKGRLLVNAHCKNSEPRNSARNSRYLRTSDLFDVGSDPAVAIGTRNYFILRTSVMG